MQTVTADKVNQQLENGHATVVNVLSQEDFEEEHILDSINIPQDNVDEFEERFDTTDEIIVYCASESCPASPNTAEELESRGFENVSDYEGGLADWKDHGFETEQAT